MPSDVPTLSTDQSVEHLRRELTEAREQQAATAEIVRVMTAPRSIAGSVTIIRVWPVMGTAQSSKSSCAPVALCRVVNQPLAERCLRRRPSTYLMLSKFLLRPQLSSNGEGWAATAPR